MSLCKDVLGMQGASVVKCRGAWITAGERVTTKGSLFLAMITLFTFLPSIGGSATYTINVSLSTSAINPTALQQDIFGNLTTGYYLGTIVADRYQANTYRATISGKNPSFQAPSVSTTLLNLDTIADKLTKISTDTFVYGYVAGMAYERKHDIGLVGDYFVHCDSAPYFDASSIEWSSSTCNTALGRASNSVYQQNFSSPTVVPGF